MNSLASHIEYLLRSHDCVVLPRWGAFLCNYTGAHLSDVVADSLLPPSRSLVFNNRITESDGLLAKSVSRREGITFEAAVRRVEAEADAMRSLLAADGRLEMGRLGAFTINAEGAPVFHPAELASINGPYFGLKPLQLVSVEAQRAAEAAAAQARGAVPAMLPAPEPWYRRWRGYAAGAVASVAVVVTAGLLLLSPITVDSRPDTASIAPVPQAVATTQPKAKPAERQLGNGGSKEQPAAGLSKVKPQQKAPEAVECETPAPAQVKPEDAAPGKVETAPVKVVSPASEVKKAEPAKVKPQPTVKKPEPAKEVKPQPTVKKPEPAKEVKPQPTVKKPEPAKEVKPQPERKAEQKATSMRFDNADPFCVIVASFPTESQAQRYMSNNSGRNLDILHKDGKYRVYAATASSYRAAEEQRDMIGQADAWICRK